MKNEIKIKAAYDLEIKGQKFELTKEEVEELFFQLKNALNKQEQVFPYNPFPLIKEVQPYNPYEPIPGW